MKDTLTKYLAFSFAVVLVYTAVEFLVSTITGVSHDTITTCLYAFFGTEIGACAFIKIAGRKKDDAEEWDTLDINEEESDG